MPSLHRVPHTLLLSHTLAQTHSPRKQMGTAEGQQDNTWWEVVSVCVRTMWRNVHLSVSLTNHYSTVPQSNYRQTQCILQKFHTNTFYFFFCLGYLLHTHTHTNWTLRHVQCPPPAELLTSPSSAFQPNMSNLPQMGLCYCTYQI